MPELLKNTFSSIWEGMSGIVMAPLNGQSHLFWIYSAMCLLMAAWSYRRFYLPAEKDGDGHFHLGRFFHFCFPKEMYTHPSAVVDYQIFLANGFVKAFLRLFWLAGTVGLAALVNRFMVLMFGNPNPDSQWTPGALIVGTIVIGLSSDFSSYLTHMISHNVKILWELHRVHHTAEVLTPITLFRKHPLYDLVGGIIGTPIRALTQGVMAYVFVGEMATITIFGGNLVYSIFRFFGANLRHSHIWFHWGSALGRVFMSPAMHQIHHSVDPKHFNKNYGEILSLWDWLFGSLYLPKGREEITFGVAEGLAQEHPTLIDAYLIPLRNIGRIITGKEPLQPGAAVAKKAAVEAGT
ncbi:MAG: sterol desaturase family protein [Chrysiogenetes bacterium]|nr:sterol desaturase family protein [Chrysiogenetes bacterium]